MDLPLDTPSNCVPLFCLSILSTCCTNLSHMELIILTIHNGCCRSCQLHWTVSVMFICDDDRPPAIICHAAKIVLIASECGSKIHIYASCQHKVTIKYPVHGVSKCTQLRNSYYVLDDSEKNTLFFLNFP